MLLLLLRLAATQGQGPPSCCTAADSLYSVPVCSQLATHVATLLPGWYCIAVRGPLGATDHHNIGVLPDRPTLWTHQTSHSATRSNSYPLVMRRLYLVYSWVAAQPYLTGPHSSDVAGQPQQHRHGLHAQIQTATLSYLWGCIAFLR